MKLHGNVGDRISDLNDQVRANAPQSKHQQRAGNGISKYNGQAFIPVIGKFKNMPLFVKKDVCIRLGLLRFTNTPPETDQQWYAFITDLFLVAEKHGVVDELVTETLKLSEKYPYRCDAEYDENGDFVEKAKLTKSEQNKAYALAVKLDEDRARHRELQMKEYYKRKKEKADGQRTTEERQLEDCVSTDVSRSGEHD